MMPKIQQAFICTYFLTLNFLDTLQIFTDFIYLFIHNNQFSVFNISFRHVEQILKIP